MVFGLQAAQRNRKRNLLALGVVAASFLAVTAEPAATAAVWSISIKLLGVVLIVASVAGRAWCAAVIGRRKKVELVTGGPFSISRNPLYLFTVIGALGVGFTSESILIGILISTVTFVVHDQIIRREEAFLRDRFGAAFEAYCQATPRWLSFRAQWRPDTHRSQPDLELVLRRGAETGLFFFALPLLEGIEHLQQTDILPVLIYLP